MRRENFIEATLSPGSYVVWLSTPWLSFVRESTFSVYGPDNTQIIRLPEHNEPSEFLCKAFMSHAQNHKL